MGVVFRITRTGTLTVIHNFDGTHGANPFGPLVKGTDGNLHGTAANGGANGGGIVFKITTQGGFTLLHSMNPAVDGGTPLAGLVQATDGNFYGVNGAGGSAGTCSGGCGTLFRFAGGENLSVLYSFDTFTGMNPVVTPMQHTNGLIYGDTSLGGSGTACVMSSFGCGVFYSLNVGLGVFITFVRPVGKIGHDAQILGQGLTATTGVTFNGVSSTSFKIVSDTFMLASVPDGATTGPVIVTTPGGVLTSNTSFFIEK
jgi:uncharacterized repeat protein (TIGR03803 family)